MFSNHAQPAIAGPSKLPIPRLPRREESPRKPGAGPKHRVTRACLSCRSRKIKCDGKRPRCVSCAVNTADCVYVSSRKDRLKTVTRQNQDMISLLRHLRGHVSDADRQRIENLLTAVEDDVADAAATFAPAPEAASSTAELDELRGKAGVSAEAGSNGDLDIVDENLFRDRRSRASGFMGKPSEVQWLRRLNYEADISSSVDGYSGPYGPSGASAEANTIRVDARARRQDNCPVPLMQSTSFNFWLDDETLETDFIADAFELPPFETAEKLLNCFLESVQDTFPILIKKVFVNEFYQYYASLGRDLPHELPQKWKAVLNLVFAIGSLYAHRTEAEWLGDERDHLLYHARAWELSLKDPWWFSHPDLQQMQITGLLAFYYLAIGHVNRSWAVSGMALRFGYALGLHMRNEDRSASLTRKEFMSRIWWALFSLDRILSAATGRPSVGIETHCSVPLPLPLPDEEIKDAIIELRFGSGVNRSKIHQGPSSGSFGSAFTSYRTFMAISGSAGEPVNSGSYLKNLVRIGEITQMTLTRLYNVAIVEEPWEVAQAIIVELSSDLEAWASSLPSGLNFLSSNRIDSRTPKERMALEMYYHSTKILITRPCLCRLDRRIDHQTRSSSEFNQRTAAACVAAAKGIGSLLPADREENRARLYQICPWHLVVHNIMQALSILMLEVSYEAIYFPQDRHNVVAPLKKLIRWLRIMSSSNGLARRAYSIAYELLRKLSTRIKIDVSDLISEDAAEGMSHSNCPHPEATLSQASPHERQRILHEQHYQHLDPTHLQQENAIFGHLNLGSPMLSDDFANTLQVGLHWNLMTTPFDEQDPFPFGGENVYVGDYSVRESQR